jgi:hypothetical protein
MQCSRQPAARTSRAAGLYRARRLLLSGLAAIPLAAQSPSRAGPPLQFSGFEVGQSLAGVAARAGAMGGRLHCDRSRSDATLRDCRAVLRDSTGGRIELWLSAVDSGVSVMTLAARVGPADLARWQGELLVRHGSTRETQQGTQHTLQWIRANTMLRLTWRADPDGTMASVSLVDGTRLDAWGRRTEHRIHPVPRADSVRADTAAPIR